MDILNEKYGILLLNYKIKDWNVWSRFNFYSVIVFIYGLVDYWWVIDGYKNNYNIYFKLNIYIFFRFDFW